MVYIVTIKDIAKEAGVSISAVSYVINNNGSVSDEKRERILAVINKYNYRPNTIAKSLKRKRTQTIGVLTDLVANDFVKPILNGISQYCYKKNYNILLANDFLNQHEKQYRMLLSRQVEGIIYVHGLVEEFSLNVKEVPVVFAYCYNKKYKDDCIIPDDVQGGYLATNHMIELGHRKIACITGPIGWKATNDRLLGYQKALNESDIYFDPSMVKVGDWSCASGYKLTKELIDGDKNITAIFAFNDLMAAGVMKAIKDKGLKVPDDIAVIGYDDREMAAFTTPSLTTIAMPLIEIGAQAAKVLIDKIEGTNTGKKENQLPCKLIIRESCGMKIRDR